VDTILHAGLAAAVIEPEQHLLDLLDADAEAVRQEFEAIIAVEWPAEPPGPTGAGLVTTAAPRRPEQRRTDRRSAARPGRPLLTGTEPWATARSPPPDAGRPT
jgi:hypothetical protein